MFSGLPKKDGKSRKSGENREKISDKVNDNKEEGESHIKIFDYENIVNSIFIDKISHHYTQVNNVKRVFGPVNITSFFSNFKAIRSKETSITSMRLFSNLKEVLALPYPFFFFRLKFYTFIAIHILKVRIFLKKIKIII